MNKPTAKYIGPMHDAKGKKIKTYDVHGGIWDHTTMTEQTLIDLGIPIPQQTKEKKDENQTDG